MKTSSDARLIQSLEHNLGFQIMEALHDPQVVEILLNPDCSLWVEKLGQPMEQVGRIEPAQSRLIISLVASSLATTVTIERPIVEGELPLEGSRFEGILPPVTSNPTFTIRKKASSIFTLSQYVSSKIMPQSVQNTLEQAVANHQNILVVGGTGSGKTTLVNGIINSISLLSPDDRLIIIEDTAELQANSRNNVFLRTSEFASMNDLLRATMRLRPDRILVGEVRGAEALTLLKSWNTGHPGGVATVHANSALGGLTRLEQLIAEATPAPMQILIGEAVDLVVFIQRMPKKGRAITEVLRVHEYDPLQKRYVTEVLWGALPQESIQEALPPVTLQQGALPLATLILMTVLNV